MSNIILGFTGDSGIDTIFEVLAWGIPTFADRFERKGLAWKDMRNVIILKGDFYAPLWL
jgi:hypothetical protein